MVVDLQEHREPLLAGGKMALSRREPLQVGGVFDVGRVELARELNLVDERPDVQVGGVLARLSGVGAGGDLCVRVAAGAEREHREQRKDGE